MVIGSTDTTVPRPLVAVVKVALIVVRLLAVNSSGAYGPSTSIPFAET